MPTTRNMTNAQREDTATNERRRDGLETPAERAVPEEGRVRNDSEGNDSDAVQADEAILPLGQRTTAEGVIPTSEGEVRTRDVRGAHDPRAGTETIEVHLNKIKRKISEANGEFARLSMSAMSGMAMGPEARRCAFQTRGVAENALGALHGLSRQLALNEALREELPIYEEAITTLSNHARNLARDARTSIELSESQPTYVEETTNGKTTARRKLMKTTTRRKMMKVLNFQHQNRRMTWKNRTRQQLHRRKWTPTNQHRRMSCRHYRRNRSTG